MPSITETFVKRAEFPVTGAVFHRDDAIRGFGLRVNWGGTKAFILEVRVKGRVRRMTLGPWPDLTVLKARRKALEWKAVIADGGDPTVEIERARSEPTFKELADRYLENHAKPHRRSWLRDERRIKAHFAQWNGRQLSEITPELVVRAQHDIAKQHGRTASNRAMSLLGLMFNLARQWRMYRGDPPTLVVKKYAEAKRERFLAPDELARVNEALLAESSPYWRAYFPLLLMTGTRKNELLSAKWADLDLDAGIWRIPGAKRKTGESLSLPLPEPAIALLKSLPSFGKGGFVFPGEGASGHLVEVKAAWFRIRKRAGVEDVTVHDLRRTLGSWLAASGYSLPMIGRALGHRSPSSTAIYARIDPAPIRAMLESTAAAMGFRDQSP